MSRPRTPVGTFGDIHYSVLAPGKVRARTRFRDVDGQRRQVEVVGVSRTDAEHRLKQKLATRPQFSARGHTLTADSSFGDLVTMWLDDLDLENALAPSTRSLYERNMRQIVLPAFEHFLLREITVARVETYLKTLAARRSYSYAKQAKTVLNLALGLAVRYEAIPKNPVRDIKRMKKPPSEAVALTLAEVADVRAAARSWRRGSGLSGPPPDGQLEDIIEVMLGTSARIGEVLAIRKCDVDVTVTPATVRICGTIVSPRGGATHRQEHPKTRASRRTIAVPSYVTAVLQRRLKLVKDEGDDHLMFFTRNGTPLTTNNVRRRLRAVLEATGIEGVTPHAFRRTVATIVDRAGGAELAAELLGHTSSDITKEHYIQPDDQVNPMTAQILEALAPEHDGEDR